MPQDQRSRNIEKDIHNQNTSKHAATQTRGKTRSTVGRREMLGGNKKRLYVALPGEWSNLPRRTPRSLVPGESFYMFGHVLETTRTCYKESTAVISPRKTTVEDLKTRRTVTTACKGTERTLIRKRKKKSPSKTKSILLADQISSNSHRKTPRNNRGKQK